MSGNARSPSGPGLLTRLGLVVGLTVGCAVAAWKAFEPDEPPGTYPVDGLAIAALLAAGVGALLAAAIITVWRRRAERQASSTP